MLDLGTSFLASVARDPEALAIVDGDLRLSYRDWLEESRVVAGFDALGLRAGDHLVTVLANNWQAATIHWACQFAGIIVTPLNWRATSDELDFCLSDARPRQSSTRASRQSPSTAAPQRTSACALRSVLPTAKDLAFDPCSSATRQASCRGSPPMPGR